MTLTFDPMVLKVCGRSGVTVTWSQCNVMYSSKNAVRWQRIGWATSNLARATKLKRIRTAQLRAASSCSAFAITTFSSFSYYSYHILSPVVWNGWNCIIYHLWSVTDNVSLIVVRCQWWCWYCQWCSIRSTADQQAPLTDTVSSSFLGTWANVKIKGSHHLDRLSHMWPIFQFSCDLDELLVLSKPSG